MKFDAFVGGQFELQVVSADAQRTVNLYPQRDEGNGGKNSSILLSTPGLRQFCYLGDNSPIRAEYLASNGRLFAVAGTNFWEIFADGSSVVRGTVPAAGSTITPPPPTYPKIDIDILNWTSSTGIAGVTYFGPNPYANGDRIVFGGIPLNLHPAGPDPGYTGNLSFLNGVTGVVSSVTTISLLFTPDIPISAPDASGLYNHDGPYTQGYTTDPLPSPIPVTQTVSIADNGLILFMVDGPTGYVFDFTTNAFNQITDPDFPGGYTVGFIDGRFVFNEPESQKFWWTEQYSPDIDSLSFSSAEGSPDVLVSLLVDHEEIWLFGRSSTEVWYDSGDALSPFARIQGAFITHGIAAKLSPERLDNTVFWLGNDEFGTGMVWRANGYSPVRVSTHAMEQAIQRYPTIEDATSYTYQQDGHSFYVLNFPSGNATWVYDAATQMWHERAFLNASQELERARPNAHTFAFGKHLVGDWEQGIIYEMNPDFLDDNGANIARIRRAPFILDELKRVFFSQFQLDMEKGVGIQTAENPDPQITLRWSDDGGYTWSNEMSVSMGQAGEYRKRVIWRRLGTSRQRVFEVKCTEKVRVTLYNAYIELSGSN